ncbi:DUF2339 domain-containing protein [Nocardia sp. PE-7]|uniref:DUF2339 domain-containing protein n=1 Tax=Nocardia sp. PE-7 TaxID=3058426 RepID=UPI0026597481|nr:DUF2339 domain-containing protein [Nocardia sp. PE-7]WKG09430.1 DUF2339 domain-containing protein [Nocardia sp. PE-7]
MSTTIDPALVARLSGEFTALGVRMGQLGGDLDVLSAQLRGEVARAGNAVAASSDSAAEQAEPGAVSEVPRIGVGEVGVPPEPTGSGPQYVAGQPIPSAGPSSVGPAGGMAGWPVGARHGGPVGAGAAPNWAGPTGMHGGPATPYRAAGMPLSWASPTPGVPYGQPAGWAGAPGRTAPGWVGSSGRGGQFGPARAARVPWWQREGVISRVLAVAGVGVTLVGVLMLLVLAAQAGFFGPVARVVAGAALSVVLVGLGWRVFGRPGGRVGGIALVATGIAGLYLDVVAVTGYYRWIPGGVGLAVALGVALVGLGIAVRWQSQPLAVGVVLGAAVLSPALTTELMLLGFLVVLQAAGVPVQMRRNWPVLQVARTLPVVLAVLGMVALSGIEGAISGAEAEQRQGLLIAAIACAVVGLVGALLAVRRRPGDITASITIVLTALPVLAAAVLFDRVMSVSITAVLAAVLLGLAATVLIPRRTATAEVREHGDSAVGTTKVDPGSASAAVVPDGLVGRLRIARHTALVAGLTGAVALLQSCTIATGDHPRLLPTMLFAVGLAFLGVAAASRTRVAAGLGIAFALLGGLVMLAIATPETLALQRLADRNLDISTAVAAVVGLGAAAMVAWTVPRLPRCDDPALVTGVWISVSIAGLYYVLVAAVSLGVSLGGADGFIVGHSLATIVWMVAATGSLFYGLRRLSSSPAVAKVCLVSGLLVAAAALAKLFLFDLATLSGLIRVTAFLAVGILLLLTGTRYARAFADAAPPRQAP